MKKLLTVWTLSTLVIWSFITNTYAAGSADSLNLDSLIWSLSNSNSTWTTTTNTTTNTVTTPKTTQKKITVTKVNSNDYNIKN